MNTIDPRLKEWATEVQAKYLDAVNEHGNVSAAATAIGVHRSVLGRAIQALTNKAALKGYSPAHDMTRAVPDTHIAKGISTYYNKDGKPAGQWVKSTLDDAKAQKVRRAMLEALADELPRLAPVAGPAHTSDALCNVYTLTDSHVGMLAWHKEGGADWDLKIAESVLTGCFEHMVRSSPAAHTCVVAQLGDFLHSDSLQAVTPTSGHILDQDGRYSKMVSVAIRILRRVIDFALAHHERVIVLMAEGNHDMASSVWLRHMYRALYENEPRVEVLDSELPYYCHQHGQTMLAWHHGHLKKNDQLPSLFASQYAKVWGNTLHRYCHVGHRHHVEEKEHNGMTVMQHGTLAARDAYSARGGWVSGRQVTSVTYHHQFGQVARNTVTPEMIA